MVTKNQTNLSHLLRKMLPIVVLGIIVSSLLDLLDVGREVQLAVFVAWVLVVIMTTRATKNSEVNSVPHDPYMTNRISMLQVSIVVIPSALVLIIFFLLQYLSVQIFLFAISMVGLLGVYLAYKFKNMRLVNAVSEKSERLNASMQEICDAIPQVARNAKWKLPEADDKAGHFRIEIGMTLKTYCQTMRLSVTKVDAASANIEVNCEAHGQTFDFGKNDEAIRRFYRHLDSILSSSEK